MVTVAPGKTAPLESVTLPASCAVDTCANADALRKRANVQIANTLKRCVMRYSSLSIRPHFFDSAEAREINGVLHRRSAAPERCLRERQLQLVPINAEVAVQRRADLRWIGNGQLIVRHGRTL